jgi:RND family efflux transporter MFP subunit
VIDMMARRSPLIVAGVAVLIAGGLSASACSGAATPPPSDARTPTPVTTTTMTAADLADTLEAGGLVQARTTATLTARLLAPVREVRVKPGDRVRAGQVLVVLAGDDLGAEARRARAGVVAADQGATAAVSDQQAAEAGLALARASYERIAGLHARRSATAQELDTATAALKAADARAAGAAAQARAAAAAVESARAGSDAAGTRESFAVITAPFDGLVTESMVETGNMAAPGAPLLRLEDTRAFRLDVRVDASRIGAVSIGTVLSVLLDSGTADGPTTVDGTVIEIGRAVDADARAFLVKIALPDDTALRSGTFGRARFSGPIRRALVVPADAIVRHGQMTSVFVIEDGIARLRFVNVSGTEVLAGLAEGDVVVVAPPPGLVDGHPVTQGGR